MLQFRIAPLFAAALLVTTLVATQAFAHSFTKGDIVVGHPWTRATPAGTEVGVGYLKITNNGKEPDVLTAVTFEGAASVEIHEMKVEGDKATMRQLRDGLEVKPGETVELKPQGIHLMLIGLKKPIAEGPNINGSVTFKHAGTIDLAFKVEPIGAMGSADHKH